MIDINCFEILLFLGLALIIFGPKDFLKTTKFLQKLYVKLKNQLNDINREFWAPNAAKTTLTSHNFEYYQYQKVFYSQHRNRVIKPKPWL